MRAATGERVWFAPPADPACAAEPGCSAAQTAPAIAIPGVVFSGSLDGHLCAYDTRNGAIIWDFDTLRSFVRIPEDGDDDSEMIVMAVPK